MADSSLGEEEEEDDVGGGCWALVYCVECSLDRASSQADLELTVASCALFSLFPIWSHCLTLVSSFLSPQLDKKEQTCMANCMDRYIDTMKVVGGALSHAN